MNPAYVELGIVDRETFDKVQAIRSARQTTYGRGRPSAGSHLFRKAQLRCGACGGAMVPRTAPRKDGTYEAYYCYERSRDPESCSMPPQDRERIDTAVFNFFTRTALDVEATRAQLADARDQKLAEVRAVRAQAEADEQTASARLARVRRDYQDGKLDPDDWREQRIELTEERDGARAKANRLRDQEGEVESWAELQDVESETLRKLSDIRAVMAGEVADAAGVDAVRAVLSRLFDHFVVHLGVPDQRVNVELIGEPWIEPVVREEAIEGYADDDKLRPILRREALDQSSENDSISSIR